MHERDWEFTSDPESLRRGERESRQAVRRLHAPMEEAIQRATSSLEELPPEDEDTVRWWETLLDEGTSYLEDLLGLAFTAAQTQIRAVESPALT